ncbi:MAG: cell wall hydrolase [Proteobacteria bacterium]|nr:cell wall hydrolase [Pseudomonadota bacterium]
MDLTRLKQTARKPGVAPGLAVGGLAAATVLGFALSAQSGPPDSRSDLKLSREAALAAADGSEARLYKLKASFDPSLAQLVSRHDPARRPDLWGRPAAWASYDVSRAPSLGLGVITTEDARKINALLPGSGAPPAKPFFLKVQTGAERARALRCLTQAVYYEAALEPRAGQEAVAQVVLNRVRHPEYPNSVCGVVYQGWERWTGCQFSFTCDGSLLRAPMAQFWRQAEEVAVAALNGRVQPVVGTATHYHADYVMPYWRPSLTKVGQIGAHIFYRWPGMAGQPRAFTSRYTPSGELRLSDLVLAGRAARPTARPGPGDLQGLPGLPEGAPVTVETIVVADANGEQTTRVRSIIGGRRLPTAEDIRRINEVLDQPKTDAPAVARSPAATPAAPYADNLPMAPNKPKGVTELPVTELNKPVAATEGGPAAG